MNATAKIILKVIKNRIWLPQPGKTRYRLFFSPALNLRATFQLLFCTINRWYDTLILPGPAANPKLKKGLGPIAKKYQIGHLTISTNHNFQR